jgi:hypothetical protein
VLIEATGKNDCRDRTAEIKDFGYYIHCYTYEQWFVIHAMVKFGGSSTTEQKLVATQCTCPLDESCMLAYPRVYFVEPYCFGFVQQ